MKKLLMIVLAAGLTAAYGQNTTTETPTPPASKAMLDGKVFAVVLSAEANPTGKNGNADSDRYLDDPSNIPPGHDKPQSMGTNKNNDVSAPENSVAGQKLIMRFENGMFKTNGKGDFKTNNCTYNSWGMESTGISFTTDCRPGSSSSSINEPAAPAAETSKAKSAQYSGTVNGDTIHGTITCTKNDGTVKNYAYTGSVAGKNDLDGEGEMGMK